MNNQTLTNHSLLSHIEYVIDNSDNLKITKRSLLSMKTNLITLDKINPEPSIEMKPETQRSIISFVTFTFGMLFIVLSQISGNSLFNIFSGILCVFSIIFLGLSLRYPETSYTFFFKNTKTKVFSIVKNDISDLNDKKLSNNCDSFINELKHTIQNNNDVLSSEENTHTILTKKLDAIYNYGIVNDTVYEIIENAIKAKTSQSEKYKSPSRENVIAFNTNKKLMKLA